MRLSNREVTELPTILEILDRCKVFRLAIAADMFPYIVPLNYGYQLVQGRFAFYFHCAHEGKKLELLAKNNCVCFEMDCDHALRPGEAVCNYSYNYSSVIGTGRVEVLDDVEEKKAALRLLMRHQTGEEFVFTDQQAATVTVCKITVEELTAKQRQKHL